MSAGTPAEDYTLKREEVAYTAYLERMVLLLSKRIIWTLKEGSLTFSFLSHSKF